MTLSYPGKGEFQLDIILVVGQVTIQQIHGIFIGIIILNVLILLHFIKSRFDQPSYNTFTMDESLLLKSAKKEDYSEELKFVLDFYHNDFNESSLQLHLQLLGMSTQSNGSNPTLFDIIDFLRSLSLSKTAAMSEVCTLAKLTVVSPATNAVSQRSASGLCRIKNYLHYTMSQQRLNILIVYHIHKYKTTEVCINPCLNDFVCGSKHRFTTFG